jgi:hypothetical protein|tara:strand:+ start:1419 stop:1601 length:183 start_codon:yes stop_codon:yes gene_type:complete
LDGLFRYSSNPWGQRVLEGVSWDLLWVFFSAGLLFICLHLIYLRIIRRNGRSGQQQTDPK